MAEIRLLIGRYQNFATMEEVNQTQNNFECLHFAKIHIIIQEINEIRLMGSQFKGLLKMMPSQ